VRLRAGDVHHQQGRARRPPRSPATAQAAASAGPALQREQRIAIGARRCRSRAAGVEEHRVRDPASARRRLRPRPGAGAALAASGAAMLKRVDAQHAQRPHGLRVGCRPARPARRARSGCGVGAAGA
jgi:hypothetical protein